eukprot:gb/GFBE01068512.1/.p1 GENE.gb/GFBE01068512.1/~~gb/GFBE01068512.1/.p1  ORF type:complete len:232 (+),score=45.99 gb/GFBE01068512.1/:1-696(+)
MKTKIRMRCFGTLIGLDLDLGKPNYQLKALAHVSALAQMCLSHAEGQPILTPAEAESVEQLKSTMRKIEEMQQMVLQAKEIRVGGRTIHVGAMHPLPAILSPRLADEMEDPPCLLLPEAHPGQREPAEEDDVHLLLTAPPVQQEDPQLNDRDVDSASNCGHGSHFDADSNEGNASRRVKPSASHQLPGSSEDVNGKAAKCKPHLPRAQRQKWASGGRAACARQIFGQRWRR